MSPFPAFLLGVYATTMSVLLAYAIIKARKPPREGLTLDEWLEWMIPA